MLDGSVDRNLEMLSDAGRVLVPYAERAVAAAQDAENAVRALARPNAGPVALAVVGTLAGGRLSAILKRFATERSSSQAIASLGNHRLDEYFGGGAADEAVDPGPGTGLVHRIGNQELGKLGRDLVGGAEVKPRRPAAGLLHFHDLDFVAHEEVGEQERSLKRRRRRRNPARPAVG